MIVHNKELKGGGETSREEIEGNELGEADEVVGAERLLSCEDKQGPRRPLFQEK